MPTLDLGGYSVDSPDEAVVLVDDVLGPVEVVGSPTLGYASEWSDGESAAIIPWDSDGLLSTSLLNIPEDVTLSFSLPPEVDRTSAEIAEDNTVVYEATESNTTFAARIEDGGLLTVNAIALSADAAEGYSYTFSDEYEVDVQETGAAIIRKDGMIHGVVEHAVAVDAEGRSVPSLYVASDDAHTITQEIDTSGDVSYPVVTTFALATHYTHGDYVHITSGEASAHGWWTRGTTKATTAVVTVKLQAYSSYLGWHTVKTGQRTLSPGTGKRANARYACIDNVNTYWRSIVDVDLVGYFDSADTVTTTEQRWKCGAKN